MTEQEEKIVDTGRRLKITIDTEGWKDIVAYILVRTKSMKNELSKIDLSEKVMEAAKKQGEIQGINSILNRINNVLMQAEQIEAKEKKLKEKKEK